MTGTLLFVLGILLSLAPNARAGRASYEGFTFEVPAGWRTSRGATSDGQMGFILEPTSVADGEESFVFFIEPLVHADLESQARALLLKMLESGRPSKPVDRVRHFDVGGRPVARAELVGSDPYNGEPARVIYWLIGRDSTSVLVFRAVILESRLQALAATLEQVVRSVKFPTSYVGPPGQGVPPPAPKTSWDSPDVYGGGSTGSYYDYQDGSPPAGGSDPPRAYDDSEGRSPQADGGGSTGSYYDYEGRRREVGSESEGGGVQVDVSESRIPEPMLPIQPYDLTGNFCLLAEEGQEALTIQFDGKGQWARHQGDAPEKFSLDGVQPSDSGFYKAAGTHLTLSAHTGEVIRCSSPAKGALLCDGRKRFEKAACAGPDPWGDSGAEGVE